MVFIFLTYKIKSNELYCTGPDYMHLFFIYKLFFIHCVYAIYVIHTAYTQYLHMHITYTQRSPAHHRCWWHGLPFPPKNQATRKLFTYLLRKLSDINHMQSHTFLLIFFWFSRCTKWEKFNLISVFAANFSILFILFTFLCALFFLGALEIRQIKLSTILKCK